MTKAEKTALLKKMVEEATSDSQQQLAELLQDMMEDIEALKRKEDAPAESKPTKRKYE